MQNVSLQCISGPLAGQIFRMNGSPAFIFGRYAKTHFSLAVDPAASHLHFLIDVSENRVRILDLGSTNGLVINERHYGGKLGTPFTDFVTLHNGDIVLAGSCMFRLNIGGVSQTLPSSDQGDHKTSAIVSGLKRAGTRTRTGTRGLRLTPSGLGRDTVIGEFAAPDATQMITDPGMVASLKEENDGPLPEVLGFSIVQRIAGGGKGVVYKAIKNDSGATAAIKMLLPAKSGKPRSIEVFRREIQVTKQLRHPNIIRYLADGMADGMPYLALEFAAGGTLDDLIAVEPTGRMDIPKAVPLFIQILEAVAYMHSQSLVHRDIKPKNILLDIRRGGSIAVKLSDMGLACRFSSLDADDFLPIVSDGGTPAYMPPEQLIDITRAIPQSDVFSASATFYQMLTGALLYDFRDKDQAEAIIEGNIKPILYLRPDLPLGLANVISKGLSYNPENRYENAQEMLDVLKQALA